MVVSRMKEPISPKTSMPTGWFSGKDLSLVQKTVNLGADGRTAMQGDVVAYLHDCQEVVVERCNWTNHHATPHQPVITTMFDGEARW